MLQEAVQAAEEADIVVLAIGEDRLQSGEATSNANVRITEVQEALVGWIADVSQRILQERPPGTAGARAIVDTLFGKYNPSGKLPMSFPYCVGQVPVHYNEYSTGRPHIEGKDKDRFRSKYLDIPNEPLYPFGYGLSYTTFEVSDIHLDRTWMDTSGQIEAEMTVKNTGNCTGTETLQLYIHDIAASVVRQV